MLFFLGTLHPYNILRDVFVQSPPTFCPVSSNLFIEQIKASSKPTAYFVDLIELLRLYLSDME